MKGVGRIYQQTFIDTYSRVAFAKLYTEKTAVTAAHMLNETVLPWFNIQAISLLRILTDRGTEYCGKVEEHAYQLFLAVENIDHSRTRARSPQTNGICERFHKTMKHEFYDITFRKKVYRSLEELQEDVDSWLKTYNELRPHSGTRCFGKTPMQTFMEGKTISKEKQLDELHNFDHNVLELAKAQDASVEASEHLAAIAPSTKHEKHEDFQGAKCSEVFDRTKNKLQLADNSSVS